MRALPTISPRNPRSGALRAAPVLGALLVLVLSACTPKVEMPRVDDSDYVFPDTSGVGLTARESESLRRAWNDILTGQVARAEEAVNNLMRTRPGLLAAQTLRGFAALRAERMPDAAQAFESVLKVSPDDASALVGLASVKRRMGQLDEALPLYQRAQQLRPGDGALARRAAEVKLQVAETSIARAGALSAEGRKAEAILMLQRALGVAPELALIRLQLADLLIEAGRRPEAVSVLEGTLDADRNVALKIASLRLEDGDLDGAEQALQRGLKDVSEDPEGASLLARIRDRRALMALPEQLRGIGEAPRITRAELAALVVLRVEALQSAKPVGTPGVASDLSRTWARPQVLRALQLGLMDVYPNHTFQPSGAVRRGELAVVAARVLDLLAWGKTEGVPPRDMSPSHLQYKPVLRVVGAGVMQNNPEGAFEPWRLISGSEAKAVVDSLARLPAPR